MGNQNKRHVVPNDNGGWDVKAPGAGRASAHADTQKQARTEPGRSSTTPEAAKSSLTAATARSATLTRSPQATTRTRRATPSNCRA